ncbi:RNA polymerase sigma factor [Luteitalea pratensis]|uniref:RNA polymerase sigma factor n=1 Tax=Luteitalea pratensis TaxID=1855912 RepID=A0A143PHE9_LUTPR|nr:ECF-type sigma factor [Luteitalea pratensis]AMY07673.1 RNA polymerase sigma factor [Luteitalea pratensis]
MTGPNPGAGTLLLQAWGRGDIQARDDLFALVHRDLRARAAACLRRERRDHTLQPTALIHETYLRLVDQQRVDWQSRAHFLAIAARMMRRVLVDHARRRLAIKRPDHGLRVALDDEVGRVAPVPCDVLALHAALEELERLDERQAHIVELRYFAGMSEDEIATALAVSRSSITREWQMARAWLYRRLTTGGDVR